MFNVQIDLIDDENGPRTLEVIHDGLTVQVKAHVELADGEVREACRTLGELEQPVYSAWRARVGIDPSM